MRHETCCELFILISVTDKEKVSFTIKTWADDDQPRYKLRHKGSAALSDSELLALLIGSGSSALSAVDLCKEILHSVDGDLNALARLTLSDLMTFKGIGDAKAITISAALELGRRRQLSKVIDRPQITNSRAAYEAIAPMLYDKTHEEFWILYLSRSNRLIERVCMSVGGVSGTVVDPKLIFSKGLQILASTMILCHNHPSGQLKPSSADLRITQKLKDGGVVLDIKVVDHLIIGHRKYLSMADEGLL
ncbi:UNVERIFIED_CONTAM: hypothetical protein GTU68_008351 [Idotea baltica]|nr:hypothetical protein [Idotea baltica]